MDSRQQMPRTVRSGVALIIGLLALCMALPVTAQEEAGGILYGSTVSGRVDNNNPRQVYFFDGLRGEVVTIDLEVTGGDLDPVLAVFDSRNTLIAALDDSADGRVPVLPALRLPRTDRFYIAVGRFGFGLGTTAGSYTISLERVGVSSASGSMLRYGDQVINSISDMTPQLYYSFRASRGDIVNVRMRRVSGNLDSYLQVVDSNAFVLADNDDTLGSPTPFDSAIEGLVIEEDGTYVIVASRYGQAAGTSAGNFVLTLEEADHSGLGNTPQTALPLRPGETVTGELTNRQFARYHRFQAQADDIITVRMNRTTGSLDSFVVLADAGLTELVSDDDSGGGQNALIDQYRIPADGTYYIIATRFEREAGQTAGGFRLELQSQGNAFDAVPEGVQRIGYGMTVTGRIDNETPELLYAFWGVEGDTITVSMNRGDGNLDPVVSILNSDQRPVVSDDDSGGGQNARINEYRLPVTGTYYVRATRYSGETGNPNTEGSFVLVLARLAG
ncbi:MAG TPA: PPC domain-containing protein [Spirillospora sp.]|nr:PPC domain-containing protein [Spirillospora sp.]